MESSQKLLFQLTSPIQDGFYFKPTKLYSFKTVCKQIYNSITEVLVGRTHPRQVQNQKPLGKKVNLIACVSKIQIYRKLSILCCIFSPTSNAKFQHTDNLQFNKGLLVHRKRNPATHFEMRQTGLEIFHSHLETKTAIINL